MFDAFRTNASIKRSQILMPKQLGYSATTSSKSRVFHRQQVKPVLDFCILNDSIKMTEPAVPDSVDDVHVVLVVHVVGLIIVK
jgi:hypothetical protein